MISGPGRTLEELGRRARRPSSGPGMTPASHSGVTTTGLVRVPPGQPMTVRRRVSELGRIPTTRGPAVSPPGMRMLGVGAERAGVRSQVLPPSQTGPTSAAGPRCRRARPGRRSLQWSVTGRTISRVRGIRRRTLWTSRLKRRGEACQIGNHQLRRL